jgi:hypothetical protein
MPTSQTKPGFLRGIAKQERASVYSASRMLEEDLFSIAGRSVFLVVLLTLARYSCLEPSSGSSGEAIMVVIRAMMTSIAKSVGERTPRSSPILIFPYFRRVAKHANLVAQRQQGSDTLTMSDDAGDCRRPRSTQRWRVWPPTGFDRSAAARIRS